MSLDFRATQIQTQKLIASGSTGTGARLLFYDIRSDNASSPNNGNFTFGTNGIGQDIFLFISGGIGTRGTNQQRITCIGGDLHVSGNFTIGGNNNIGFRLQVTDYASTQSTSSNPEVVGQVIFPADQFSGSLELRTILSTTVLAGTASVKFWNLTSGTYVDIGGAGQTILSTSNLTPTIVGSVNLIGANGFSTGSQSIYELHAFTSTGSITTYVGGAELRPSGSFSGISIVSSSAIFISGTWIDNNSRLRTTASVAIGSDNIFAQQKGQDVYFYVSGTQTSGSSTDRIALFGGSLRVSGNLAIGSGSIILESYTIRFSTTPDVAISNSNGNLILTTPNLYCSGSFFVSGNIFSTGSITPVAGIIFSPNKITGNYTILNSDYLLTISASNTLNLILPSNPSLGKSFIIKDISGSASSSNITITTGSTSHRIDGVGTYILSINYSSIQIAYLDTNFWGII